MKKYKPTVCGVLSKLKMIKYKARIGKARLFVLDILYTKATQSVLQKHPLTQNQHY